MNWLAHLYLSEPDFDFRLGNLLADLVKGDARNAMGPRFLAGVDRHRQIDAFTDCHAVVERSKTRIRGELRRFSGILVDIFYDHYLARHWNRFDAQPLAAFTTEFHVACDSPAGRATQSLPPLARQVLGRMIADERLMSYREVSGIRQTLALLSQRIVERTGRPVDLTPAVEELVKHDSAFEQDFLEFFPDLQAAIAAPKPVSP